MKTKINRFTVIFTVLTMCNIIAAVLMLKPFNAKGCEISNDYLALYVQEDAEKSTYGGFMLFKNNEELSETLTYSQFYSSFAAVDINGTVSLYSDGSQVKAPYIESDGSVVTVQDFDGIEITQTLSFAAGNSDKADMLKIEYSAENTTDSDALVSIRLIIDPTLSDSEGDFIQANGTSFEYETDLTGDSIPESWYIENDEGEITAYGITSDSDTCPDLFQAANWHNLYNNRFAYTSDSEEAITDNAAALTWSDKKLESGEIFSCSTKYGLYSSDTASDDEEESEADTDEAVTEETNSMAEIKKTSSSTSSPKTGDNIGYVFAILAVCSATAAMFSIKREKGRDE